ncbi:peptide deformylase [Nitrospina sp. 32_T5]|uniref:peptide deformylase n=1 Tax=unclassified Nitrospina TaxID=2638683 RepID=UPI003F9479FC
MSILNIRNCLDPVLRKKCAPVQNIDGNLVTLSNDMIETMFDSVGVGLAANQVGIPQRLIVVDFGFDAQKKEDHNPIIIVNPVITAAEEEQDGQEGCLSIPEIVADVPRFKRVEVKGVDLDGNDVRYEVEDYLARAFQHELDHLEGKLFWDMLGRTKRDMLKRKFKKLLKEQGDE